MLNHHYIWIIFPALFIASLLFTRFFRYYAINNMLMDHPNHRSSHTNPTPRGGGLVFAMLWLISLFALSWFKIAPPDAIRLLGIPAIIIMALGYIDDLKGLPAKLRFAIQIAATLIFLYRFNIDYAIYAHNWITSFGPLVIILTALAMLWSTNLFNFMDGTDGIASIEAVTVFGVGGFFPWLHGGQDLALLAWSLIAGVLGFLCWNWPRASIFMGDVASSFLGFLIIPFALIGYFKYQVPIAAWFILYLMFSMDATLTLIRRLLHREKFYQAHKLHAYQRLHQAGCSHQQVLYITILMNIIFSVLAYITTRYDTWMIQVLVLSIAIYIVFYMYVEKKQPMYPKKLH